MKYNFHFYQYNFHFDRQILIQNFLIGRVVGPTQNPKYWRTVVLISVCLLVLDLSGLVGPFRHSTRSPCRAQALPTPVRYQHKGETYTIREDVTFLVLTSSPLE